jgi:spore coat polysaccharide biosynthesis protein SpsF (cytidylyltransferase family)
MGSSRLPGKVLADVCGQPMIARQIARMELAQSLDEIVVAIPDTRADDVLAQYCLARGWAIYRGPELDVLLRYLGAAEAAGASTVVRVTADCPLIDPLVIDDAVELFQRGTRQGPLDFVSNNLVPTYPHGLDVEVMSRGTLAIAEASATEPYDREHVTPWITRASAGGAIFRLGNLASPENRSHYRLTVDYPEDLALVRAVYERFQDRQYFDTTDVLRFLDLRPDLTALNRKYRPHVQPMGTA